MPTQMAIEDITAKELKKMLAERPLDSLEIIDVRQPVEYENGHVPGARLLPLNELPVRMGELTPDRDYVLYCHSGARSAMASDMLLEEGLIKGKIFNLSGGFLAYDGKGMIGYPALNVFECGLDVCDSLLKAFELLKGAWTLYHGLAEVPQGKISCSLMADVAKLKYEQADWLYAMLRDRGLNLSDFKTYFEQTKGEILQNGRGAAELLAWAKAEPRDCAELADLALNLEYAAFELYRDMARQTRLPAESAAFMQLAEAQKKSINLIAAAIV